MTRQSPGHETVQDTNIEVKGASNVENTSHKSARTILCSVVNEYANYQDQIFSQVAIETISEKTSLHCEQPAYYNKSQSREGFLLSITLRVREVEVEWFVQNIVDARRE